MIQRCLPGGYQQRNKPAYIGCNVHPDFIKFQDFAEWCNNQIGFGEEDFHLDKDILVPGNKVYGPDTCVFVPSELNRMLQTSAPGVYPVGVSYKARDNRYQAKVSVNGVMRTIGAFKTPDEAAHAYINKKHDMIMKCVEKWEPKLDPRIKASLMKWTPGRH